MPEIDNGNATCICCTNPRAARKFPEIRQALVDVWIAWYSFLDQVNNEFTLGLRFGASFSPDADPVFLSSSPIVLFLSAELLSVLSMQQLLQFNDTCLVLTVIFIALPFDAFSLLFHHCTRPCSTSHSLFGMLLFFTVQCGLLRLGIGLANRSRLDPLRVLTLNSTYLLRLFANTLLQELNGYDLWLDNLIDAHQHLSQFECGTHHYYSTVSLRTKNRINMRAINILYRSMIRTLLNHEITVEYDWPLIFFELIRVCAYVVHELMMHAIQCLNYCFYSTHVTGICDSI